MKRGDLVVVVLPGAWGKPRPALLIQADEFRDLLSVTVLPLTSDLREAPTLRISLLPGPETGLRIPSQIQVDKPTTVPRAKVARRIGTVDPETLAVVDESLGRFLGLATGGSHASLSPG